ncbi:MAG: dihydropteroate synthase [Leptospirales bacterium]
MPLPDIGESLRLNQETYQGPLIMGVINVTPDSFSGHPEDTDPAYAFDRARRFLDEGADVLDIGAESTRPGFIPVSLEEEKNRLLPVLDLIARLDIPLSIDTRSPEIIRILLPYGIQIINDVSGLKNLDFHQILRDHPHILAVLMHSPGDPSLHGSSSSSDIVHAVQDDFRNQINLLERGGISRKRLLVDPGLGFGKNTRTNLMLLHSIDHWAMGCQILIGASRKRFIGEIAGEPDPLERDAGTLAIQTWAHLNKVSMIRTHDVRKARQARSVFHALLTGDVP